jgi:predicted metalloprotease with PDZ domain
VTALRDGRHVVTLVHSDSPAEAAGIAAGDELLAVDDVRVSPVTLDARLREHHAGDRVTLTVFRNDELLRFRARIVEPPEDTCWLDADPEASPEAEQRQKAWLTGSPP